MSSLPPVTPTSLEAEIAALIEAGGAIPIERCMVRNTGLVSTRWTGGLRPATAIARSASTASVPRPGPSST